MVVGALIGLREDPVSRGILAVCLLLVPVAASVVANNRAAMRVNVSRHYLPVSFLPAGLVCLVLACPTSRTSPRSPAGRCSRRRRCVRSRCSANVLSMEIRRNPRIDYGGGPEVSRQLHDLFAQLLPLKSSRG